ncbi:GyrI-like domain-containing protein [Pontibacter chitinilyticus]|uniref:GyrI-like domain-containing protein n=1 Tax=Pontibacter chitinilyticus TaxID=2674989 RepID=UPI0032193602
MEPSIKTLPEKQLVGKRLTMSFAVNKTFELWRSFMPRLKEIQHRTGSELYSLEVYPPSFFETYNPEAPFNKWAAVAVAHLDAVPEDMETLLIPEGLYAIFIHKGPASSGPETYQYIFETWLPNSGFILDNRPHLAVMGDRYKHDDPSSEEELLIPVKRK